MSQSHSRSRTGLMQVGLTVGAVGAAMLVAPQAAYAAVSAGPPMVMPGNSASVYASSPDVFNANTAVVQLSTNACATAFVTPPAAGTWNATVGTKTTTRVDFTVPTGPTPGTNGVAKPYYTCVYDSAAPSSIKGSATIYVGTQPMLSAMNGITGGGNQLTVTTNPNSPIFTGVTAVGAVFTSGTCNAAYGSSNAANLVATNVIKQPNNTVSLIVPPGVTVANGPGPAQYNICLYDASSASGALLSFVSYNVTLVGLNVSNGSYLTSVGVAGTSPNPFLSGVTTPGVLLMQNQACPGAYSTSVVNGTTPVAVTGAGSVRKLSNNRLAVTVPPLTLMNNQPTPYQVCFYSNATNGVLLATGAYTATVVANPTGVTPSAGPATGGMTITVTGTDFPTDPGRITATLGGVPLNNIQPINDKAFTAETPAHAVENYVALVVSTAAGTKALQGAYSFLNPLKVSPNTAPNTAPTVDVDVQGMGFLSINFGAAGNAGRVFLVDGAYNGADAGAGIRANGPVAECVNVLPINDEELICTLQLNRRLDAGGTGFFDPVAYVNTLTTDVSTIAGSRVISSTLKKFVANDVGQPIVETSNADIPANSIITSVLSSAKAVISAPALLTTTAPVTATVGGNSGAVPVHTLTKWLSTKSGSTTVSLTAGVFTSADVGRVFSGTTGITAGTTIVAVAPGGTSAMLSAPAVADTMGTLANVVATDNSTTITSSTIAGTDQYGVVGPNTIGIPVGTTLTAASAGTATLSAPAVGGGTAASLPFNRPVTGTLFAAAPVQEGTYNLTVVSNGAPDAAENDPGYLQTAVTSGSAFTVARF
jgi:IPT/TIG domain-containing protein